MNLALKRPLQNIKISIFVHEGRFLHVKSSKSAEAYLNFIYFNKISGLCQELAHVQNLGSREIRGGLHYTTNLLIEK